MNKEKKEPRLRFPGFDGEWEEKKLKEITTRVIRKNKNLESTLPLTISAQDGLINQNEYFNKTVASRDVSGYYLLKNGDFAYNKSYSNGYPWGAVKRLDKYEMGVLSTLYIVFKPVDIESDFLTKYYDTNNWHKEVSKYAAEGARNHGLLNITASDFFETELMIPKSKSEQNKIAHFFKQIENLIALHQQKLTHLQERKKGLLQKMFPKAGEKVPELRFPGFSGDWEEKKLGEVATSFSGGTPSVGKASYYNGTIPFIRSAEINSTVTELFITEEGLKNSSAKIINIGDILYALYGATSGEVGLAKISGAINQAILAIRPNEGYCSDFIMLRLQNQKKNIIGKYLQGGQGNLSGYIVKNILIKFPVYEEQNKIGTFLAKVDESIILEQKKLDHLKERKKALLQQMFI
ncbi:MAG: type restriction enzyme subunit [Eubacteriaceae bacterium]|jgi:type I restriction enzyme S subunit|nr:type restriction enzyme subunit [Eubacteriaceae bacterium]